MSYEKDQFGSGPGGGEGSVSVSSMIQTALAPYITSASVATALGGYVTSASLATTLGTYITSASVATAIAPLLTSASLVTALAPYLTSASAATAITTGTLTVNGTASFSGTVVTTSDVRVGGSLYVSATASVGALTIAGAAFSPGAYLTSASFASAIAPYITSNSVSIALATYLTSNSASIAYARLAAANAFTAAQTITAGSGGGISGPTAGTWAAKIVYNQDLSGLNGLSVQNRWATNTSTIFEVAQGFNGTTAGYYPVFTVNGAGESIWQNAAGTQLLKLDSAGVLTAAATMNVSATASVGALTVAGTAWGRPGLERLGSATTTGSNTALKVSGTWSNYHSLRIHYEGKGAATTTAIGLLLYTDGGTTPFMTYPLAPNTSATASECYAQWIVTGVNVSGLKVAIPQFMHFAGIATQATQTRSATATTGAINCIGVYTAAGGVTTTQSAAAVYVYGFRN